MDMGFGICLSFLFLFSWVCFPIIPTATTPFMQLSVWFVCHLGDDLFFIFQVYLFIFSPFEKRGKGQGSIKRSDLFAGAVLYIKREFHLQTEPTIEGLIVAMSLIGATAITTFSGPVADWLGRRPMLIISSVLYFLSGLVMLWSPNVYVLLLARLLDGFGIGLAVTLVPVYISETAPSEIRGLLNTLPQFTGSGGMFLSYCMVFWMSLMDSPKWRLMLGVLSIPSLLYFALTVFYLPESPRWLVSKGRMAEAKQVLQRLRGREDVAGLFINLAPLISDHSVFCRHGCHLN